MRTSDNIRLYKAFPDDNNPEGYLPINGSLVRDHDTVYLEVTAPEGYGVAQIRRNGEEIRPFPTIVERRYKITVDSCSDNYAVVLGRTLGLRISVTQDNELTYPAVF